MSLGDGRGGDGDGNDDMAADRWSHIFGYSNLITQTVDGGLKRLPLDVVLSGTTSVRRFSC